MRAQNELFRSHALGSFAELVADVTVDPAMLIFLSGIYNHRWAPNENYARELMELFTLGADRGAYTETDVRSLARALTGWRADWNDALGFVNFRFDATRYDTTSKTLWAGTAYERSGDFDWRDACTLVLENPFHRSHFVAEAVVVLHPQPARREHAGGARVAVRLQRLLDRRRSSRRSSCTPTSTRGAPLVKPPAVYTAGLLRATGQTITHDAWVWLSVAGRPDALLPAQRLGLERPRVAGHLARCTGAGTSPTTRWMPTVATDGLLRRLHRDRRRRRWRRRSPPPARPPLTAETYAALLAFAEQPSPAGWAPPTSARCARTRCASSSPPPPTPSSREAR